MPIPRFSVKDFGENAHDTPPFYSNEHPKRRQKTQTKNEFHQY